MDSAYNKLIALGIRPSIQRVAIMKYLQAHHTHPTVEDVYLALKKQLPTVSRTTVYNTLRMLSEHHAASMITMMNIVFVMMELPSLMLTSSANVAKRCTTLKQWKCLVIRVRLAKASELTILNYIIKVSVLHA